MSFPRYPEYRDSGVEWLGEVPGHWANPPIYLRYSVELGKMLDASRITGDHLIPYLRNVDVQWGRVNFDDLPQMDIMPSEYGRYTVAPGDLLVCEGGEVGRAAIVPERRGTIGFQKALHRLRTLSTDEHPAFMYFTLSWAALRGVFNQGGLSTIAHLTGEQLRKYRFPRPPIAEQIQIAAFLDRETAKIDALVAEQQNLIALLKEKRQALISHAVTKGLDPDVPMKKSGVAWLGEVPAHWKVLKLKHVSPEITVGIVVEPSKYYCETGVPALRSLNVQSGSILLENLVFISEEANEILAKSRLRAGDIVAVRSGQPGTSAVVPKELDGCNCIDLLIIRRPKQGSEHYLCWYLSSDPARRQFAEGSGGAIQQHFNVGTATSLLVATPPASEQLAIDQFLRSEVSRIDALVVEAEATISLLQERRTALISAAVTGKIDVRRVATVDPTPEPA